MRRKRHQASATALAPDPDPDPAPKRTRSAPTPAAFFATLPRELRDKIYHEIWKTKPPFEVTLGHNSIEDVEAYIFKVVYESSARPQHEPEVKPSSAVLAQKKTKPWYLASKRMLSEVMEQFNHQATWKFIAFHSNFKDRQPAVWRPPKARTRPTRQSPILLSLHGASSIDLSVDLELFLYSEIGSNERPQNSIIFYHTTISLLTAMRSALAGTTTLRHLSLVLIPTTWGETENSGPIDIVLGPLNHFDTPSLQSLQVTVRPTWWFSKSDRLMQSIRESVEAMGKRMISSDVVRETFEDVGTPLEESFVATLDRQEQVASGMEWRFVFSR
ncbi:uncharacterized protein K460DRAFT_366698 [Cucurbitaria berberidis CBS 394.84]|uniref:Uncharacterized protein n=1 Tax=Cucurbitaria berberidis CBS 394.84 TaxID=1168544 RepID=A0A9P4GGU4_9PLEO|nr:uncharacterized protein K460DRAFT_366698 [Cucurbitaria berberidis CBS 394.84]KAF1845848.1 hypothetical protein K460DRAFT_366698 [Cucurbitaria berberidis CBS 394.84]